MKTRIDAKLAALASAHRAALVTFVMAGAPDPETSLMLMGYRNTIHIYAVERPV